MAFWTDLLKFGTPLLEGFLGHKAAGAQQNGAQQGLDFAKGVYGDAQNNFSPYLGIGTGGINGLQSLLNGDYSGFYNSPDYKSARDAMTYGLDHSAAAKGNLFSGGYQADLSAAQGNLANNYLGNYRNSLMGLAGLGAGAAGTLGQIGSNATGHIMDAYNNIGQAQAQGYGAIGGGLAGFANQFGANNNTSPTGSAYTPTYFAPSAETPYNNPNWTGPR